MKHYNKKEVKEVINLALDAKMTHELYTEEELLTVYRELFPEERKLSCPIPILPATFAVSDGRTKRKR